MKTEHRVTFSALLLAFMATGSSGVLSETTYYQWQDEQGNLIVSDRPPAEIQNIEYETVRNESPRSMSAPLDEESPAASATPRAMETKAANAGANASETSRDFATQCQQAKGNMTALTVPGPVMMRTGQGEARELSPVEIKIQIQTTQAQIDAYCQ